MQAGGNYAEAVQSDPLGKEPCVRVPSQSQRLENTIFIFCSGQNLAQDNQAFTVIFSGHSGQNIHSMLVNVELAERFHQEPLKLGKLPSKVRLLLITRTKISIEILLPGRSTLRSTHVSVRRWLQPPNFADRISTCLLPTLLVGLTSLSQPNSPSTFHHFLLAAEIRSFLTLLHSQPKHQVLTAAGSCLPGPSHNSSLFRKRPQESQHSLKTRERKSGNKVILLLQTKACAPKLT